MTIKNLDWIISILLGFVVVYSGAVFYGLYVLKPLLEPVYGNEIYTYGQGSFLSLISLSSLFPSAICTFACNYLLKPQRSLIKVVIVSFFIFFTAITYSCYNILWPNYVADFGATWTTTEIIKELILCKDYVLLFFILISLSGAAFLGFIHNQTSKGSGQR